ncbi:MAG: ATP-binding protein involved in chromosome partitioning [Gammaproteobacteria bacterium]|jgi:ATP-binding protein involved in chromosome partitioning
MKNTTKEIELALACVKDPILDCDYQTLDAVDSLLIDGDKVRLKIKLGYKAASLESKIRMAVKSQLEIAGFPDVDVQLQSKVLASSKQGQSGNLSQVKNIVAVSSAKGGVGKSTTAVNLALALHAEGAKVGILDADIYGPSQRTMLGVADDIKPQLVDEKFVKPIVRLGIKSMSIAYMNSEKTPVLWRGPMAVRALQQFLEQTLWGELDYLIVDMPPGTGDIQISLAQQVAVSGAVIITTPQEVALVDVRKGIEMFNKTEIPVLGIVENMAAHSCSKCGHQEAIFGSGGAEAVAEEYNVNLLGSLPLDTRIRANVDAGLPTVASDPTGNLAEKYIALANQVSAHLWKTNLNRQTTPVISVSEV